MISDGAPRKVHADETDWLAMSRVGRTRGRNSGIQPLVNNVQMDARSFEGRLFVPFFVVVGSMVAAPSFLGRICSRTAIFRRLNAAHTRFHSLRTFCWPRRPLLPLASFSRS